MSIVRNSGIIINGGKVDAGAMAAGPGAYARNSGALSSDDHEEVISADPHPTSAPHADPTPVEPCEVHVAALEDHAGLHVLLAELFTDPSCADQLLDRVGIPRERRPNHGQRSPSEWWYEALREMQKGVVEDPLRRLVTAALDWYPYNPDLRRLLGQERSR